MTTDTRSMDEKLLPCPFCGGDASVQLHDYTSYGCGCINFTCPAYELVVETEKSDAIARWNRRTQSEGAVRTEGVDASLLKAMKTIVRPMLDGLSKTKDPKVSFEEWCAAMDKFDEAIAAAEHAASLPQHAQSGVVEALSYAQWYACQFCGESAVEEAEILHDAWCPALKALATPSIPAPVERPRCHSAEVCVFQNPDNAENPVVAESELREAIAKQMRADYVSKSKPNMKSWDDIDTGMREIWLFHADSALAAMSRLRPTQTEKDNG